MSIEEEVELILNILDINSKPVDAYSVEEDMR